MVSNLVSGMMQRIEKLRKYAFASVLVLGEDNNAAIEGVWVMRGQELAFNVRMDVPRHIGVVLSVLVFVIIILYVLGTLMRILLLS